MKSLENEVTGPRSLTRLLGLFAVLAKTPDGQTLAELNTVLKSPKSSLLNLLRPLVAEGYLTYENGHYRLGPSIFRLAANIVSVWNFSNMLRPFLEELAERTEESVFIGMLDRVKKEVIFVDAIQSRHAVRYSVPRGATRPLYCTAAGRVLLAFGDKKFQEEYLRSAKLEARTPQSITTRTALREALDAVSKTHVSVTLGEMYPGAAAIGAPIFGADGKVIAAMVVGAPVERLQQELPTFQRILTDVATRASGLNSKASRSEAAPAKKAVRASRVRQASSESR